MLGSAASVFAGSALLLSIGALLLLIFALDNDAEVAYSVGLGAQLVSYLVLIAAFVTACIAFLGRDERRGGRLAIGAALAAGGFFALLVFYEIFAALDATHAVSGTGVAAEAALGAGALFLMIGAVFVAINGADAGSAVPWRRDGRRGWASISLAVGFASLLTGEILTAVTGASSGSFFGLSTAGSGVTAVGWGLGIGAGVTAAVGFLISRQRRSGEAALRLRDLLLAVASVVLAVVFLLTGIGGMLRAGAVSDLAVAVPPGSGFGQIEAYFWLVGVGQLVLMIGAICGAIGFFLAFGSRRARSRPTSRQVPTTAPAVTSTIRERTPAGSPEEGMARNGLARACACGYQNRSESVFCRSCGTRIERQGVRDVL